MNHEEYQGLQDRRANIRDTVECPLCRAPIGRPCLGKDGKPRKANHSQRNQLFKGVPVRPNKGPQPQPVYPAISGVAK